MAWITTVRGCEMVFETDTLPAETLSPLATRVDEVLAGYGYELGPAIEAIDDAVPGFGGLFDPGTDDGELRAALDDVGPETPVDPTREVTAAELVLYVDGSSRGNPGPAGAGAVLVADGTAVARLGRPVGGRTDNNIAEYAALHLGVEALVACADPAAVEVRIDSRTVIDTVWGDADPGEAAAVYASAIDGRLATLPSHDWTHLADSDPNPADARATVGADIAALGPG